MVFQRSLNTLTKNQSSASSVFIRPWFLLMAAVAAFKYRPFQQCANEKVLEQRQVWLVG